MEDAIEILTNMIIRAHFEKDYNREKKIRLVLKALKLVQQYDN